MRALMEAARTSSPVFLDGLPDCVFWLLFYANKKVIRISSRSVQRNLMFKRSLFSNNSLVIFLKPIS